MGNFHGKNHGDEAKPKKTSSKKEMNPRTLEWKVPPPLFSAPLLMLFVFDETMLPLLRYWDL